MSSPNLSFVSFTVKDFSVNVTLKKAKKSGWLVITSKFGKPVLRKIAIKEFDLAAALVLQRAPTIGPPANVSPLWLACRYRLFKGTGVILEKPVIFPNVYSLVRFLQRRGGTRGASNATFCLDLEAFFS